MNTSSEFESAATSLEQALQSARATLPPIVNESIAPSLFDTFNHGASNYDYNYRSDGFLNAFRQAAALAEAQGAPNILRALVLRGLESRTQQCTNQPERLAIYTFRNAQRIADGVQILGDDHFSLDNDRYMKDLAFASGRLTAVGSFLVESNSGVPRSVAIKRGIGQALEFAKCMVTTRGVKPYIQSHLNMQDLEFFNEQGSLEFFADVAQMLQADPSLKGFMRANWFIDPAMAEVSPHLAHFADVPLQNGAYRFFVGWDDEGKSGALSRSNTRKQLFQEGRYRPAYYMMVWPRKAMLRWLDNHQSRFTDTNWTLANWH